MGIQVDTSKVYKKSFDVREKYGDNEFSKAERFELNMRIPDTLTGDDLATHIMSEIVIRCANKLRKLGWAKFKDARKTIEVTLNAPGTRSATASGMTPEKFATLTKGEQKTYMLQLAKAAGGYKEDELEELFGDDQE